MADSLGIVDEAVIYRLEGQIVDGTTGAGIDAIVIDLADAEGLSHDLVAHAKTNALGEFSVAIDAAYYDSLFLDRRPALGFRIYKDGQLPQPTLTWTPSETTTNLRIPLYDLSRRPQDKPAQMVVRGRVLQPNGTAVVGNTVTAVDQTLRGVSGGDSSISESNLGSTTTDSQGQYRISFDTSKLVRVGSMFADLVIRVRTGPSPSSTLIVESRQVCHAPTTATIDLVVGNVALRGLSEYERVRPAVLAEIDMGSIAKVTDAQIPYLACTVEQPENIVRTLVEAHRLAEQVELDVVALYGILRQGFPPKKNEFLTLRPAPMLEALARSISANIIPTPSTTATNFEILLKDRMIAYALTPRSINGGSALGDILPLALADTGDRTEFVRTLITHDDDSTFWTAIGNQIRFTPAKITKLQRILQWGVFSRYHIPLVTELERRIAANEMTQVRDLAKLDETQWRALLDTTVGNSQIGTPSDIPGATLSEKRDNYAKILDRTVETAFPTAVIANRIQREANPDTAGVVTFLGFNSSFDFKTHRVASYIATNPTAMTGVTDVQGTTARLKGLERIFRLTPRYTDEMKKLLAAGLDSALSIHNMGRATFVNRFTSALGKTRAEQLYGRACWVAGAATALFGKFSAQLNNVPLFALPDLAKQGASPNAKAADWATLFGSPDACACEHCRSVYSPAAYLVDLLEFLDRHDTHLLTGDPNLNNPQNFTLRDLLIGDLHSRPNPIEACRPDIARLELSCANTNTTLPYIDLVNEIMEMVVANIADNPDHNWPTHIPTEGDADELLAEPKILDLATHDGAYLELNRAVHPFDLPWNFWAEEARVYLEHLGVPRHELLQTFIGTTDPNPTEVADKIARERLRLSLFAWQIITNQVVNPPTTQAYWGMSAIPNWMTELSKVPRFLKQSGLTFDELRELLQTNYVNHAITLVPEAGCDIDVKVLQGLTTTNLERLHRFLRLRLHAGLTISEMDRVTTTFGLTDIDDAVVRHVADLLALKEQFGLSVSTLLSFWGTMGTNSNEWSKSIYEEVFLNRAVLNHSTIFQNLLALPAISPTIADHIDAILQALRISVAEFALLTSNAVSQALLGLNCVVASTELLSLDNVSRLFRVVVFARALGLSVAEYLILRSLSGINALDGDEIGDATPALTRAFVKRVHKIKASALNAADLQFLARHVVPVGASAGMTDEAATGLVAELESLVNKVITDGPPADSPIDSQPAMEARFDVAIQAKLASVWNIDAATIGYLLAHVLHSPPALTEAAIRAFYGGVNAPSVEVRKEILRRLDKLALLTQRLKFGRAEWELTYPDNGQIDWTPVDDVPLSALNNPTGPSGYHAQFQRLVRFIDLAMLRDVLPNKAETMRGIGEAINNLDGNIITKDQFFDEIARLTLWSRDDLAFLMTHGFGYSGPPPEECDCLEERAYLCMYRSLQVLKLLGAKAEQVSAWSNIDSNNPAEISLDIKRVTRAHYDLPQWTEVARGIRDGLREKQRDALVHYLISKKDLRDSNALFEKLLVDVEMSACQLTSRIKMAIGSVQTFIQRVLLGLMASTATLGEDAAHEWSWLKNYRVWEANRKIFLYPENWIEPELRDDKTPFFRTLESRLLQGEITAEAVESAYVEYLENLHEVARLEVAAICHELDTSDPDNQVDIVHVIARTQAAPHRYYYRKRMDSSYWTAWEKVDVEIQGDHLLATVWNRRLYLFWPMFGSATEGEGSAMTRTLRIDIAWTHRDTDRFAPVSITKDSTMRMDDSIDPRWISLVSERVGDELLITVLLSVFGAARYFTNDRTVYAISPSVVVSPCIGKTTFRTSTSEKHGWVPRTAAPEYMQFVEFTGGEKRESFPDTPTDDDFSVPMSLATAQNNPPLFATLLGKTFATDTRVRYSVVIERDWSHAMTSNALQDVFAYADPKRTFFAKLHRSPIKPEQEVWFDSSHVPPLAPAPIATDLQTGFDPLIVAWLILPKVAWQPVVISEGAYHFQTFYHPYVCDYTRALARDGIDGLLRWSLQGATPLQTIVHDDFEMQYVPNGDNVAKPYPIENVDFTFGGAYGQYNWELFFHAPFLIATRLTQNSRFEDADRWYRYIFDPTGGAPGTGPERFWYVRPFRENLDLASIQEQLEALSAENPEAKQIKDLLEGQFDSPITQDLVSQIAAWRETPFNPHLIARMRPIAYQKSVVMKYIDNLLQWGDSLFRRETIEAINEATQLYILAQNILGNRPRVVKTKDIAPKTYIELEPAIDAFSNALVEVESLVPPSPNLNVTCPRREPPPVMRLYFCVPPNDKMLGLWDTVEDRLFKIRHCMDIEGNVRQLALFEPPIDPTLLVRAAAAGLDINTMLLDLNAPLPLYRFAVLLPKAMDFAGSVISMGNMLLSVLEKRDGETLSRLRATQEINMLTSIRVVRQRQIDEAKETLEGLRKSKVVVEERLQHYLNIKDRIDEERQQKDDTKSAQSATGHAQGHQMLASIARIVPQVSVGTGAFTEFGGAQVGSALEAIGQFFAMTASEWSTDAALAGTEGSYKRRAEEWTLQRSLAGLELVQIDKQILAGEIRLDIATKELANHELSLKNANEVEDHLRTKFTNEELYVWLLQRVKEVYFQGYKLAYDMAKRAERTFNFELATSTQFVGAAHWDSTMQGLMAGERLQQDLRRMDAAYIEQNKREYEITKHVSLAEVDPKELMKLRGGGKCAVKLDEELFEQDWPGHYLRRIKSVSVTVPVTNAPYGSVNCKLAITQNKVRKEATQGIEDTKFYADYQRAEAIIISAGQQDSGMFELVFRDERYLPFEGAGAISEWEVTLKKEGNRFDPATIHDLVLHVRYISRDKGATASAPAGVTGYRLFSAKTDFPAEWHAFVEGVGAPVVHKLELPIALRHFQPLIGDEAKHITQVHLFARRLDKQPNPLTIAVTVPGGGQTLSPDLSAENAYGTIMRALDVNPTPDVDILADAANNVPPWTLTTLTPADELDDIWLICEYSGT